MCTLSTHFFFSLLLFLFPRLSRSVKKLFPRESSPVAGDKKEKRIGFKFPRSNESERRRFLSASLSCFFSFSQQQRRWRRRRHWVVDCRYLCSPISCHLLFLTTVTAAKFFKNAVRKKVNWIFLVSFSRRVSSNTRIAPATSAYWSRKNDWFDAKHKFFNFLWGSI